MKKYIVWFVMLATAARMAVAQQISTQSIQPEFPRIIYQPENQLVPLGSNATFIVIAQNGPLTYQWLRNGVVLDGLTNSGIIVLNAQIEDVGLYSCNISKGLEVVPTARGIPDGVH